MDYIELTDQQISKVIYNLAEEHDTNGKFVVDIHVDDELDVTAEGWVEIEGYVEDGQNGTGAFVETHRRAHVELTGWAHDHLTEDEVEVEIGHESIAKVEKYLNAA